jgi:hypothetical protein
MWLPWPSGVIAAGMDRTWKIAGKKLEEPRIREAGAQVAQAYEGVSVEVEREDREFITLFFSVPVRADGADQTVEVELTVYDMGRDGLILSLEEDASDNNAAWEDASQLAEDLADGLGGEPIDV